MNGPISAQIVGNRIDQFRIIVDIPLHTVFFYGYTVLNVVVAAVAIELVETQLLYGVTLKGPHQL